MRNRLDPASPVPLYWQVAEALRYRVATGELTPGERLPSLRDAAGAWGINMHTVRRAYGELAELGIVEVRPRSGTVVLERSDGRTDFDGASLESWLREVVHHASGRWGLGPGELRAALADLPRQARAGSRVFVLECSESQSADLARQLADRWRVEAEPWSLGQDGEPDADAVLVGTYFHYNDVRVRWPHRFPDVRFVAIRPDPSIRDRLEGFRDGGGEILSVVLRERDEAMARNIAADLHRILPKTDFRVRHEIGSPSTAPDGAPGPVLFSPRTWAELPEDVRLRDEFMEVRYVFEERDIEGVARELKWERR